MIEGTKEHLQKIEILKNEIRKKVVGQDIIIEKILIGILCDGHILLEGVPGVAKSLIADTMAEVLGVEFSRIQFTPDLLPSDVLGSEIYRNGEFQVHKGPIFSNFILADEINRAPAKVQSALLEAMQERQVSIGNETFKLDYPFMVIATQNPIDQEGTYTLPEAQQDRFLFKLIVDYPKKEDELGILKKYCLGIHSDRVERVLNKEDIFRIREIVSLVHVDDKILNYILKIVLKSRDSSDFIECGASPRASINLVNSSKARAFLQGRDYVIPDDVKYVVYDVLRHRIILSYEGEAEGTKVEGIIAEIIRKIEI